MTYYSARSSASAEYWIHFTVRLGGVHAFGYNYAESEPIWMKFGTLRVHYWGWPWQILGAISAVATAEEPGEILLFLSGKQRTISRRPNFTKFEHNGVIPLSVPPTTLYNMLTAIRDLKTHF